MQTVKITMELTLDQARALFANDPSYALKKAEAPVSDFKKGLKNLRQVTPGEGLGYDPFVDDVQQYQVLSGVGQGRKGRPESLTVEGMKKVWSLYQSGYSIAEISRSFSSIASDHVVRRVVKLVKTAGKKT